MMSKNKIIKIIFVGVFAFGFIGSLPQSARAQTADRALLLAQVEAVKRQILLLQIQLIQMRIFALQEQLALLNLGKKSVTDAQSSFIDLIYPVGGEKLENRRGYYILWEARGVDKVSIELQTSESARIIAENIPANEGRWYWNTGSIAGDSYRLRVFDATNPEIAGRMSKTFLVFDNSLKNKCADGTVAGRCSSDKPKLCFDVEIGLIDACKSCGCPAGMFCAADSKCR